MVNIPRWSTRIEIMEFRCSSFATYSLHSHSWLQSLLLSGEISTGVSHYVYREPHDGCSFSGSQFPNGYYNRSWNHEHPDDYLGFLLLLPDLPKPFGIPIDRSKWWDLAAIPMWSSTLPGLCVDRDLWPLKKRH
ncbi:hypothetical protein ACFX2K_028341 [Malus domestica]